MFRVCFLAAVFLLGAHALREHLALDLAGDLGLNVQKVANDISENSTMEEKEGMMETVGSNVSFEMLQQAVEARHAAYKGTVLLDRFVLQELRTVEVTPGVQFPATLRGYSYTSHLGKGGFGDTWRAYDSSKKAYVAVKIFYSGNSYISARTGDPGLLKKLDINSHECGTIKGIADAAPKMGAIGAYVKYLCLCLEDHIWEGKHTGQPAFLVYELCGETIEKLIEPTKGARSLTTSVDRARTIVNHIVRGIKYLNSFQPAWIHHDLKPGNVCWMEKEGIAKLIDWGGMIQATAQSKLTPAVATLAYEDPATQPVLGGRAMSWVGFSWSYDMYATGLIYAELLCPQVTIYDWMVNVGGQWQMGSWSPWNSIKGKCSALRGIDQDIVLITEMANHDYQKRPTPDEADRRLGVMRR